MAKGRLVMLVVGARPQFIKAAALMAHPPPGAAWLLVHTGQHYDYEMSAAFFGELGIPAPAHDLDVGAQSPAAQLGEMTRRLAEVIGSEGPTAVVVVGDTASTLAGALAASWAEVPLAHVEAGMRSYDWRMPEERSRVLADRLAGLRLCPHAEAAANLTREGITEGVEVVGDVMYEVAAAAYPRLAPDTYLAPLGLTPGDYVYVTCHRQENADDGNRLASLGEALSSLELPAYFPLHPRTAKALASFGLRERWEAAPHVTLAEPTTYLTSLALVRHAALVLTDSGGVQREAYLYDVPTATLRDRTEWPETVAAGLNRLVGVDAEAIREAIREAVGRRERRPRLALAGDPPPSVRIARSLAALIPPQ
jgi:UDP-N-acetylglucosamine 2-epimerase